ncbi:hypothetical protein PybrP1_011964 [[Pythium] brassicae (nom. inval.)]|nr:hypothetical protein PybrP1_011964 [[Pythium] brassicae (nom. inval.)]
MSDEHWETDADADADQPAAQRDDRRVDPFDFLASSTRDNSTGEATPPNSSPLRENSSVNVAEVDSLVSLPSPIANPPPAPAFDVFATSPAELQPMETPCVQALASPTAIAEAVGSENLAVETQDRVAKAATKFPVPPVLPKKSSGVESKPALELATPPPALASATEADGNKSLKKRLSSSELEAASNRLYTDAVEAKKRKEVLKAELEETYSFAPQVNAKRRPNIPDEKNRFVQLHEKAKEAAKRKEEQRQKREKAECTFKPKITAKARKLSTAAKSAKPRFENLYQQAQEIKQKREVKKSESEQKAVDACSFKPKIKAMKSPTKSRPLYDAERLKQRKLALEQKKIATELSECTFKPKVVAKAGKAKSDEAAGGSGGKPGGDAKLFDRLYQASQKRAENLEKLRHEREEQEKLVATFHPKITTAAAAKADGKPPQPFHERLYSKDHMQKVTAEREQKKLEEEQKFSFKPQLTPVPDELKSKHSSPSSSPDKSIFERLYDEKDKVKDKIEAGDLIRKQKELDGCTFRPHIETSPSHAKHRPQQQAGVPIWERLLSYDKHQVLEDREKQRHELEMQECTFKPEVTPSEYFTPKKSPSIGIFDRLTGGAVSMSSADMKRRESERKATSSVALSKRRSVPELEAFKNRHQAAASIGSILRSSTIVVSPETSPNKSVQRPQSLPASLHLNSEHETLEHAKRESAPTLPAVESASSAREVEQVMHDASPPEDDSSPETSTTTENNLRAAHGDFDAWEPSREEIEIN